MPHSHSHPHAHNKKREHEEKLPLDEITEEDRKKEAERPLSSPKMVSVQEEEWDALKNELDDYKDKYLRLLADMENSRKRLQKEKQELTQYAVENVITDFLRPLDNLENALRFAEVMSAEIKNWAMGFQMIVSQFKDVLVEQGISPIETKGVAFDPHFHEAVEMIETDDAVPGSIIEECIKGYKIGDRMIRPARVKVAKAKKIENIEDKQ